MATAVPNTTTFTLQNVVDVVGGSSLSAAFDNSVEECFDASYKQSMNQLDDFRNYDSAYDENWLGYIVWSLSSFDGTDLYFSAHNGATQRDGQSSTLTWETRLAGTPVDTGSVGSGSLDSGQTANPSDSYTGAFDSVWGKVGSGAWVQLY